MMRALAAALLFVGASCAGDAPKPPDPPATVMCDGSPSPRLTFQAGGGGQPNPDSLFTGPYGHAFFVIDGTCRYWVGDDYAKGIRTGTLSGDAGEDISRRLNRADFRRLSHPCTPAGIADASSVMLSDGVNRVSGDCDGASAPDGWLETFTNVGKVVQELMDGGAQAAVPLRVASVVETRDTAQPIVPWTLTWSPRGVVADLFALKPDSGRQVTDAGEVTALRGLRTQIPVGTSPAGAKVRDANGDLFLVFARDVAPQYVMEALAALYP